jgi:polar amino acid transport system permease protein
MRALNIGDVFFLLRALGWTVVLSAMAFFFGGILGAGLAVGRAFGGPAVRIVAAAYIRFFQGTPLLIQLFVLFFAPSYLGLQMPALLAAGLGLTLNSAAFLGEIWRGALQSVPNGQWAAGRSLGLSEMQILRLIILRQAVQIAVPPTVGFLSQLVKATALTAIIGFTELTRAGQILINATFRPFTVYLLVAILYFFVCWPISLWGQMLERRAQRP